VSGVPPVARPHVTPAMLFFPIGKDLTLIPIKTVLFFRKSITWGMREFYSTAARPWHFLVFIVPRILISIFLRGSPPLPSRIDDSCCFKLTISAFPSRISVTVCFPCSLNSFFHCRRIRMLIGLSFLSTSEGCAFLSLCVTPLRLRSMDTGWKKRKCFCSQLRCWLFYLDFNLLPQCDLN